MLEGYEYIAVYVLLLLGLTWVWCWRLGPVKGVLAGCCRLLWTAPIFLALFPARVFEKVPVGFEAKKLQVFLDDSESMDEQGRLGEARARITQWRQYCEIQGCQVELTRLSELSSKVRQGYTPIREVFEVWHDKHAGKPWVLLTDGGDEYPTEPWHLRFGSGYKPEDGLIIDYSFRREANLWLEIDKSPVFAFEEKPVDLYVTVARSNEQLAPEVVQLQVKAQGKIIGSLNVKFLVDEDRVRAKVSIPPLGRGNHLLDIAALPSGKESQTWDNATTKEVRVLANTIGVLHLLGAPSWDGRFVRRYLKSEPKYDLISFFILRDPGDAQRVDERELSLIPFPVDRLFNQELPNFHLLILQNFTLSVFLEAEYQRNLVKFVKEGGGLLFIGGERALQTADFSQSPLQEILPFQLSPNVRVRRLSVPSYQPDVPFQLVMAEPDLEKRELASVYENLNRLATGIESNTFLRGLHDLKSVTFGKDYTVLLDAELESNRRVPAVIASYPGKGRAIWIFSDSFGVLE